MVPSPNSLFLTLSIDSSQIYGGKDNLSRILKTNFNDLFQRGGDDIGDKDKQLKDLLHLKSFLQGTLSIPFSFSPPLCLLCSP
jgi:hypothetical protein